MTKTPDPWIVDMKGGPGRRDFEISVLRQSNSHGRESYGWFDSRKLLISGNTMGDWGVTQRVWRGLVELAQTICDELNKEEG